MPFYLAPYIGAGTLSDSFRPFGSQLQAGWSAVDLRPDPTVATGFALVFYPVADSDAALLLLADTETELWPARVSTAVQDRIGVTATSVKDLVEKVLFGTKRANLCNPCRPAPDGSREVVLAGRRIASEAVRLKVNALR